MKAWNLCREQQPSLVHIEFVENGDWGRRKNCTFVCLEGKTAPRQDYLPDAAGVCARNQVTGWPNRLVGEHREGDTTPHAYTHTHPSEHTESLEEETECAEKVGPRKKKNWEEGH